MDLELSIGVNRARGERGPLKRPCLPARTVHSLIVCRAVRGATPWRSRWGRWGIGRALTRGTHGGCAWHHSTCQQPYGFCLSHHDFSNQVASFHSIACQHRSIDYGAPESTWPTNSMGSMGSHGHTPGDQLGTGFSQQSRFCAAEPPSAEYLRYACTSRGCRPGFLGRKAILEHASPSLSSPTS